MNARLLTGARQSVSEPAPAANGLAGLAEQAGFAQPAGPETTGATPARPVAALEPTAARAPAGANARSLSASRLDVMNVTAAKHLAAFEVDRAEATVTAILAIDPDHFDAVVNLGRIHLLRDRFDQALVAFRRARALEPGSVAARLGEAEALLGLRRAREALAIVDASLQTHPGEIAAWDLKARAHGILGEVDRIAGDCAELAWKSGYAFAGKWCEALAYKDAGMEAKARSAFESALAAGTAPFVRHRQLYLKFRGHYDGEIDGRVGPATDLALAGCAADPNC